MKIKKNLSLFISLLTFSLLTFNSSCSERNETVSCFPNATVSVQLNLSLPSYYALQNEGGWVYVNEEGSGTRGLIVYRRSLNGQNAFMIYDRNAPHICPDTGTTLEVENGTAIHCPKDNAKWILSTGQPTAVSKIAPKMYGYSFNSNILSIYN